MESEGRVRLVVMTTQKVSVTLDEDSIARARRSAGPRGLSRYVDEALAEKLERDERRAAILEYLDELEAAEPTPEDVRRDAEREAARIHERATG
jgi:hypothetical protein